MTSKLVILLLVPLIISAQHIDTLPLFSTSTVVVTADRSENIISNSTSSISVISSKELNAVPGRSYIDALRAAGGIFTMYMGGNGSNPVVSPRGFYGGGEADYALMLINGVPLNNIGSGLAEWNTIPDEYISKLEILKGGSSVLYGNAAMGGVINLITDTNNREKFNLNISSGSNDYYKGYINKSGLFPDGSYSLYIAPENSGGFRDHSRTRSIQFGGIADITISNEDKLSVSSFNLLSDEDLPGPLAAEELRVNRNSSSPYYRQDGNKKQIFNLSGNYTRNFSALYDITLTVHYKNNSYDITRTTTNAAPIIDPSDFSIIGIYDTSYFGDTKLREVNADEFYAGLKYVGSFNTIKLVAGSDLSAGNLNSRHYDYFSGFEVDYRNAFNAGQTLSAEADNSRTNYSFYLNGELSIIKPLKVVLGFRYDNIINKSDGILPDTSIQTSADAVSPKAGINLSLAQNRVYSGNLYFNYNRSFKSPTSDQLTDLNQMNSIVYFPAQVGYAAIPFKASPFSNSELKPQIADNFEAGLYQKLLLSEQIFADIIFSAYTTKINDEIDFDLNTFRYENIYRTRHTGFEGSLKIFSGNWGAFLNQNITRVRFDEGELDGNNLKGIPQSLSSIGLFNDDLFGFRFGAVLNITGKIYLDDENSRSINGYKNTDVKLGYTSGILSIDFMIMNLFDERFNYNGFLLNGREFYYPGPGRIFTGEIKLTL